MPQRTVYKRLREQWCNVKGLEVRQFIGARCQGPRFDFLVPSLPCGCVEYWVSPSTLRSFVTSILQPVRRVSGRISFSILQSLIVATARTSPSQTVDDTQDGPLVFMTARSRTLASSLTFPGPCNLANSHSGGGTEEILRRLRENLAKCSTNGMSSFRSLWWHREGNVGDTKVFAKVPCSTASSDFVRGAICEHPP